jgi:hypothetical protein
VTVRAHAPPRQTDIRADISAALRGVAGPIVAGFALATACLPAHADACRERFVRYLLSTPDGPPGQARIVLQTTPVKDNVLETCDPALRVAETCQRASHRTP